VSTRVALVHQGIWDMEKLSMPLALGYLRAYAEQDPEVRAAVDFQIFNYRGSDQPVHMVPDVLIEQPPDVLACSVFGWNFRNLGQLAITFRQINPDGWTIFGGTHVERQAERVFRLYPEVDVVVNGEGEISFANLLRARLAGQSRHDLANIRGISFRTATGEIVTTEPEPRIKALDTIPSPFLTGAIPLFDEKGEFLYDAVTMETNRGCPYKCGFCYWGGAVGQRMHAFSRERLRAELELFGRMRVQNICLCDSNFGMQPADQDFLEDFITTRSQHHFPHVLTTSWAKNKGRIFYDIVRTMRRAGLHADFTLALQTLDPDALRTVRRQNMPINQFEDLCEWLHKEGLGSYAELIWGLPGETYESFLKGYDRVARFVPRIATYSHLLLPNTTYDQERDQHRFVTIRGQDYDFEYILSHTTMTLDDNRRMHVFMFWARLIAEFMFLRHIWIPLRERCGMSQSQVLLDLNAWIETQDGDPTAATLLGFRNEVVATLDASRTGRPIRVLYQHSGVPALLERWWNESIIPKTRAELHPFLRDLFRYESITRPLHEDIGRTEGLDIEMIGEMAYFVRRGVTFAYDVAGAISPDADPTAVPQAAPQPPRDYLYQVGFSQHIDNHEIVAQYRAKTRDEIREELLLRDRGFVPEEKDRHVVGLPDASMRRRVAEVS
jgi:radical SAM C-methyltransferase